MVSADNGTAQVDYAYDALGRRVSRDDGTQLTNFTFDGQDVLMDDDSVAGISTYQNGLGIDNKLKVSSPTASGYFLGDHLGSINALTDQSGSVTASNSYDSFGNATNTSFPSRYQFTGRELDSFTGLQFNRARWYDPAIGRFISEDPIGFGGGDTNLYGYVWSNPGNLYDPFGLDGWASDLADWGDKKINNARDFYKADPAHWVWNGTVDTIGDLSSMAIDPLRLGKGVGCAIYDENATGWQRAAAVGTDGLRAVAIVATAARVLSGAASALSKLRVPTEVVPPNPAEAWLGPKSDVITNPAGDKIVLSEDGTRRIRFDFNRPHPHVNPHMHVEEKVNGRWVKSGPIYPQGVNPQ